MKIAVYAICKNEEKHVKDWLENTLDADVRVLCDTGSTDGTFSGKDFAYGLYPWVNIQTHRISIQPFRFDTARNAAMSLIPADVDWCISLDLDERLDPNWREAIERTIAAEPEANRIWVNYDTPHMSPFLHDSRVHTRAGWRWDDPCHECIRYYGKQEVQVVAGSVWIRHHPDKTKSRQLYMDLLAIGVKEDPNDKRRVMYFGRELLLNFKFDEARRVLDEYLKLWKESGEDEWLEVTQAKALKQLAEGALLEIAEGKVPQETIDYINSRIYGPHRAASTPA